VFVILLFIGIKMLALALDWFHLPPLVSLTIVLSLLGLGVGASLLHRSPNQPVAKSPGKLSS
jgi:tellurite resistance protein TerC